MTEKRSYKVRHPSLILSLVSISLLTGIIIYNLISLEFYNKLLFYIDYGFLVFCFIGLVITIYRAFKKPFEVKFSSISILINGTTIEAEKVSKVYIMGYFKPVIGIQRIRTIMVPYGLSFRFIEEENQGLKEIITWAKQNQIKVSYKRFMMK